MLNSSTNDAYESINIVNMFPGDTSSYVYRVSVPSGATDKIRFKVDVSSDDSELANSIIITVTNLLDDGILYEGIIKDMPYVDVDVGSSSNIPFKIDIRFDTSTSSDYMNKKLQFDMNWYVGGGSFLSIKDNSISTGSVDINLNDGKAVVNEILTEGYLRVKKEFFVQNNSNCDVLCRIYCDCAQSILNSQIQVTIKENDVILYKGTLANLTSSNASETITLNAGEKRNFTIEFEFIGIG